MQRKRKLSIIAALIAVLAVSAVAANTFHLIWIETPFEPNQYNWQEPWEVKEMTDFLDATLTIEGCGYQGQLHDIELVIENVATAPSACALTFSYTANWYIDSEHQEVIIQGAYDGILAVGESMIDTTTWQPSLIGVGVVQMDIIDIVWTEGYSITWTTEIVDNTGETIDITGFVVDCINSALTGTTSFNLRNIEPGSMKVDYKVEIVELGIVVAEEANIYMDPGFPAVPYSFEFGPLPSGGDLTMRLTVGAS